MWLTPKLISEFTPNPNFSANYEDNENDEDNENHPENEDESNNRANKYMFKLNNGKKVLVSYDKFWTYFIPCSIVFNVDFEHVIVHRVFFFHYKHERFFVFCIEEWLLFKDFFPEI